MWLTLSTPPLQTAKIQRHNIFSEKKFTSVTLDPHIYIWIERKPVLETLEQWKYNLYIRQQAWAKLKGNWKLDITVYWKGWNKGIFSFSIHSRNNSFQILPNFNFQISPWRYFCSPPGHTDHMAALLRRGDAMLLRHVASCLGQR